MRLPVKPPELLCVFMLKVHQVGALGRHTQRITVCNLIALLNELCVEEEWRPGIANGYVFNPGANGARASYVLTKPHFPEFQLSTVSRGHFSLVQLSEYLMN
jgi:hypothetical protein